MYMKLGTLVRNLGESLSPMENNVGLSPNNAKARRTFDEDLSTFVSYLSLQWGSRSVETSGYSETEINKKSEQLK